MARTFSGTTTGATPIALAIVDGPAWEILVWNRDATQTLNVNIPAIHGTEYFLLNAGEQLTFSATLAPSRNTQIAAVNVKDGDGAADYFVGVTKGSFDADL